MKRAVIRFIGKNGENYGYLSKKGTIILSKRQALRSNIEYMSGVAYGLTFAIIYYGDESIEKAEIEEVA